LTAYAYTLGLLKFPCHIKYTVCGQKQQAQKLDNHCCVACYVRRALPKPSAMPIISLTDVYRPIQNVGWR